MDLDNMDGYFGNMEVEFGNQEVEFDNSVVDLGNSVVGFDNLIAYKNLDINFVKLENKLCKLRIFPSDAQKIYDTSSLFFFNSPEDSVGAAT